jgi:hypothetical protein
MHDMASERNIDLVRALFDGRCVCGQSNRGRIDVD